MSIAIHELTSLRERIADLESQEQPLKRTAAGIELDGNLTLNSGGITITGNLEANGGHLYAAGKEAIRGTDGYLRLNQTGAFTSGVYTPGNLRVDGYLYVGSVQYFYTDYGGIATRGTLVAGSTGTNYLPNSGNWNSGGGTLVLNGADYTSILFHDAGTRVDAIVVGGGTIRIGPDIGWGAATTAFSGRVGINTTGWADGALYVNGFTDDQLGFSIVSRSNNNSNLFYSRNDGYLWANRGWAIGSDARLKANIEDIPAGQRVALKRVRFRKYTRRIDGRDDLGVVAQELREVYPELVSEVTHPSPDGGEPITELAVDYTALSVLLGRAYQELDDEFDRFKETAQEKLARAGERIDALEAANRELERRLARLEALVERRQQ